MVLSKGDGSLEFYMKMSCVLKLMFLLLSPMALAAGPSDGGGTNIYDDQLVDFQKFEKEFGVKQYVVDGRKMKAKGGITPYVDVKPLLDRFQYLYPGLGSVLEDTFEKDWIVVDAKFTARRTGETKAISQTGDVVYVSLPWLQKANPERVREAFTHEAVRNLAQRILNVYGVAAQFDPAVKQQLEDEFTEAVTPVVHRRLPARQLEQTLRASTDKLLKRMAEEFKKRNPDGMAGLGRNPFFSPREHFYTALKKENSKQIPEKLCAGINQRTRETKDILHRIETRLEEMRDDVNISGLGWYVSIGTMSFDGDAVSLASFHTHVFEAITERADQSDDARRRKDMAISNIFSMCKHYEPGTEKIRSEAARDQYIVRDPLPRPHEEVPLEETSGSVLEAK